MTDTENKLADRSDEEKMITALRQFGEIDEGTNKICSEKSPEFLQEVIESKKYFPLIWLTIRVHTRVWVSKIEEIANTINRLYSHFPNLAIIFDGWGRLDIEDSHSEMMIEKEKEIVENIKQLIPSQAKTYSAIGCKNYEKAVCAREVDVFIAPEGAGLVFLTWLANKRGVVHANKIHSSLHGFWTNREEAASVFFVPANRVIDDEKESYHNFRNYDFDWQIVYREAVKVIFDNKNNEITGAKIQNYPFEKNC